MFIFTRLYSTNFEEAPNFIFLPSDVTKLGISGFPPRKLPYQLIQLQHLNFGTPRISQRAWSWDISNLVSPFFRPNVNCGYFMSTRCKVAQVLHIKLAKLLYSQQVWNHQQLTSCRSRLLLPLWPKGNHQLPPLPVTETLPVSLPQDGHLWPSSSLKGGLNCAWIGWWPTIPVSNNSRNTLRCQWRTLLSSQVGIKGG